MSRWSRTPYELDNQNPLTCTSQKKNITCTVRQRPIVVRFRLLPTQLICPVEFPYKLMPTSPCFHHYRCVEIVCSSVRSLCPAGRDLTTNSKTICRIPPCLHVVFRLNIAAICHMSIDSAQAHHRQVPVSAATMAKSRCIEELPTVWRRRYSESPINLLVAHRDVCAVQTSTPGKQCTQPHATNMKYALQVHTHLDLKFFSQSQHACCYLYLSGLQRNYLLSQ